MEDDEEGILIGDPHSVLAVNWISFVSEILVTQELFLGEQH